MLEVTITISIILIGLLSISRIFPISLKASKSAEENTVASNLAQAKIEELFSIGYDNINTGTIEAKHRLASDPENPFYAYQRETKIEYVDSNLNTSLVSTGIKKATVKVYWSNAVSGNEKNIIFYVIISQK